MMWDKSANTLLLENAQSTNYVADTTGFKLSASGGLQVNTGSITAHSIVGGAMGSQAFTANGTFTTPLFVTTVYLFMVGGGGGAGGGNSGGSGGGGESGHFLSGYPFIVSAGNYSVTLGSGGSGSTNSGTAGTATMFHSLSVPGGDFGNGLAGGGSGAGSEGGASSGLGASIFGVNGIVHVDFKNEVGGAGGGSPWGTNGAGGLSGAGSNASGYGAGGGGGGYNSGGQYSGGNGSAGYCLVIW
jgi:hypothetical protein